MTPVQVPGSPAAALAASLERRLTLAWRITRLAVVVAIASLHLLIWQTFGCGEATQVIPVVKAGEPTAYTINPCPDVLRWCR